MDVADWPYGRRRGVNWLSLLLYDQEGVSLNCSCPSTEDVSSASSVLSPMEETSKFMCRNAFVDDWDACEKRINKVEKVLFSVSTFDVRTLRTGMYTHSNPVTRAHRDQSGKMTR
jgi:hypothetical protein